MSTEDFKKKVTEALSQMRANFAGSDAKFAISIGINGSQYSRIKRGDYDKVLSDAQWIRLARTAGVGMDSDRSWNVVSTPIYRYITAQLEACQSRSMSAILCDIADIGKSFTARHYAKTHKCVAYVDCTQTKTKSSFIRAIAKEFGVAHTGRYVDIYADLVFYLKTLSNPIIIIDEAGDLEYKAFLEIKALWNATEDYCGWYMMGADGLQEAMRKCIEGKKVGYTEIFSRFGCRYGKVVPFDRDEKNGMLLNNARRIIQANAPSGVDAGEVLRKCIGENGTPSLRRIYKELQKIA